MNRERMGKIQEQMMEQLDMNRELSDEEILEQIDLAILQQPLCAGFSLKEKWEIRRELFYSVRKMDVLEELLEDSSITEIMVNGPDAIFLEKEGQLFRWDKTFTSREKLEEVIQQIVGRCNRVINESMPMVDARLENGSRVNAVIAPAVLNGPILTIRRFPEHPMGMDLLVRKGSLTEECAEFLQDLVRARYSILIGGGTGSGKTTLLGALASCIPMDERVITIEDNAELQIPKISNLVRLEAKNANMEGGSRITIRDLIRTALRMRPDRIIVGEVRGEEALDMLQALNTGHDGSLCTAHANTTYDMLSRLETMVLMGSALPLEAIRRQIASGVEILIHLGRMYDKSRKVLEIAEVIGYQEGSIQLHPLYRWEEGRGLIRVEPLRHTEKLIRIKACGEG